MHSICSVPLKREQVAFFHCSREEPLLSDLREKSKDIQPMSTGGDLERVRDFHQTWDNNTVELVKRRPSRDFVPQSRLSLFELLPSTGDTGALRAERRKRKPASTPQLPASTEVLVVLSCKWSIMMLNVQH